MKAYSRQILLIVYALLAGIIPMRADGMPHDSEKAIVVIWQESEYPAPGRITHFPFGLIASVWADGRVIRATNRETVGHAYVEGRVSSKEFAEFIHFLTSSNILNTTDAYCIPVDSASRTIIVRYGGKDHKWAYGLPDNHHILNELEARTWKLTLAKTTKVERGEIKKQLLQGIHDHENH